MTKTFTTQQLYDFNAYVRVQESGRYNMLEPAALRATGLDKASYMFVLKNYSDLLDASNTKGTK